MLCFIWFRIGKGLLHITLCCENKCGSLKLKSYLPKKKKYEPNSKKKKHFVCGMAKLHNK